MGLNLPSSFGDIDNILIKETSEVVEKLAIADKIYFYDTCSIIKHSLLNDYNILIEYFRDCTLAKIKVLVITETVMYELTCLHHKLSKKIVILLKAIDKVGISILLFREEDTKKWIQEFVSLDDVRINQKIVECINNNKAMISRIDMSVSDDKCPCFEELSGSIPVEGNRDIFKEVVEYAKSKKKNGDSLAEQLIVMTVIIMTEYYLGMSYHPISIVTNDIKCVTCVSAVQSNNDDFSDVLSIRTPPIIVKKLYEQNKIKETELLDVIQKIGNDEPMKIKCFRKTAIDVFTRTFTYTEYVDKLLNDSNFIPLY